MNHYHITPPRKNGEQPELFFTAIHGLLTPRRRLPSGNPEILLGLHATDGEIVYTLGVPDEWERFTLGQLRAAHPGVMADPLEQQPQGPVTTTVYARLASTGFLPLNTMHDGLMSVLEVMSQAREHESVEMELTMRPLSPRWKKHAHRRSMELKGQRPTPLFFEEPPKRRSSPTPRQLELACAIEEKAQFNAFMAQIRLTTSAGHEARAGALLVDLKRAMHHWAGVNRLTFRKRPRWMLLTEVELGRLWYFPRLSPHLREVKSPKLQPPKNMSTERVFAESTYPGFETPIGVPLEDAFRHLWLMGPLGSGKSTVLLNLIMADINAGRGLMLLDPKSDLVTDVLERMPEERIDDVVLIRADDPEYWVALNPLECPTDANQEHLIENVYAIFERLYGQGWGIRTTDVLRHSLATLVKLGDATLLDINQLLTDPTYRNGVLREIDSPYLNATFWKWFEEAKDKNTITAPLLVRLRDFLGTAALRRIVGQRKSTIKLEDAVAKNQIVLVDLSEDAFGRAGAAMLGSFLVIKLWQAIRGRGEVRPPFMLYADEFQEFMGASASFEQMLAQARSFRLGLTLAHQSLSQLTDDVRMAISANTRSKVIFQLGIEDARWIAREFHPLDPIALTHLPKFEIAARISIDGGTTPTFTARTLPPPGTPNPALAVTIAERSKQRYARHVSEVDGEIIGHIAPPEDEDDLPIGERKIR